MSFDGILKDEIHDIVPVNFINKNRKVRSLNRYDSQNNHHAIFKRKKQIFKINDQKFEMESGSFLKRY